MGLFETIPHLTMRAAHGFSEDLVIPGIVKCDREKAAPEACPERLIW